MEKKLKDVNPFEVYKKWQSLSYMFECFVHSTSFSTLKNYPNFTLNEVTPKLNSESKAILALAKKHFSPKTLYFIDLPVHTALNHAYFLNKKLGILPVLTVRHINHEYGLIGDKVAISAMLEYSNLMEKKEPKNFVFVLDSTRYAEYEDEKYKTFFNNQYEITEYDLPPIEMLKEYGYEKVVFIFEKALKEDVGEYKNYLSQNEFDVICFDTVANEEMITNG